MLRKRITSLLLVFMLVIGTMPVTAFASENTEAEAAVNETEEEAQEAVQPEENIGASDEEAAAPSETEEETAIPDEEGPAPVEEAEEAVTEGEEEAEILLRGDLSEELAEEEPVVNEATGRVQGPEGDEDVAVMVYGAAMTEALNRASYSFSDFVAALKGEVQGVLADEKLPEMELYLVNSNNEEYRLTVNAVSDAAMISSFDVRGKNLGKIIEYLADLNQWIYEMIFDGVDSDSELYKIYGAENVPEGDYTLEIRKISGDGYTMYRPQNATSIPVHVGDDNVNYVGYDQKLGTLDAEIDLGFMDVDLGSITVYGPGIYLNAVTPGFSFTSADLGGNALPGTEFVMINRDETEKIIKAVFRLGKDTFTNAMNLVGTEGYTWKE
ncbi:MAG: hypothetical protein ACSW8K_14415, partial [bacterium]